MPTLAQAIASAALTVAEARNLDDEVEVYAFVSGPYITIGVRRRGSWGEPLDEVDLVSTIEHSGAANGLYGIEAVEIYEEALLALRDFRAGRGAFADGEEE